MFNGEGGGERRESKFFFLFQGFCFVFRFFMFQNVFLMCFLLRFLFVLRRGFFVRNVFFFFFKKNKEGFEK